MVSDSAIKPIKSDFEVAVGEKPASYREARDEALFETQDNQSKKGLIHQSINPLDNQGSNGEIVMISDGLNNESDGSTLLDSLKDLSKNKFFSKVLPSYANAFSIGANILSSLAHCVKLPKSLTKTADSLGEIGTKVFLFVNAIVNALEQSLEHHYLSAAGYFFDSLIASLVPQDKIYLAHGFSTGTYTLANCLSVVNGRSKFTGFLDHAKHVATGMLKTVKNIFSTKVLKNIFLSETSLPGIVGALMCFGGASSWLLTGATKIPTLLRDFGGIFKAAERLNPGHFVNGRQNYFFSGLLAILGAISDFVGERDKDLKAILTPLSLALDGHSKYILRKAQNTELNGVSKAKKV